MAEYITKKQALENFENAYQSSEDSQEFRYYFESFIQCLPKADVVERSKIDKAVEDIERYKSMLANPYNRKGIERVLEIFKRDIGE